MDASTLISVSLTLARSFDRTRSFLAESKAPASVLEVYDRVTSDPAWSAALGLAERAYLVWWLVEADAPLRFALEVDYEAGLLGAQVGEDEELERERDRLIRLIADGPEPPERTVPATRSGGRGRSRGGSGGGFGDGSGDEGWSSGGGRGGGNWSGDRGWAGGGTRGGGDWSDEGVIDGHGRSSEEGRGEPRTVETWLNAELRDFDTSRPLQVGVEYALALSFGGRDSEALGSALAALTFAPEMDHLDLTIRLLSAEFDTPPLPQGIRVRRDGTSVGRALFPIVPRKAGPAVLTAVVDVHGNFVQQLVLRFDVEGAPAADVEVTNLGRPAAAAAVLGPREASLRFTPTAGGYKLFAPGVTADEVFVPVTPDQLAAAIEQVRSALLAIVKNETFALGMDIPEDLGRASLRELSFAGYRLYQHIFEGPFAPPELRAVGDWLRTTLSRDVTTLQVVSSGFPVPWALLYLTDRWDETTLDWENFIGMRHVVEQVPMREIRSVPPPPTIDSVPALAVRVLYNEGIDAQMPSRPVAAQRGYWEGRAGLQLVEGTTAEDLLGAALSPDSTAKVLYLYCHAVASNKNPDDSHLVLSGNEKVTLARLSVAAPVRDLLASHPLVFVNACESGELSPNFYDGFVPYFLGKGARGVIGTECKTPGYFASEWAKAFFDRFFAGEKLGEIVLALRRQFLAEHGNPLGLLYGVYCDPDTRLDPALN